MKIYNSMTRKKEEFKPIEEGKVKMYACGITVYDLSHIGHARQAIVYSMISEYLKYRGYDVTYVRNYTDVDDKIINRANLLGKNPLEFSKEQIDETEKDMKALHVKDADIKPKASENIDNIIKFVQGLIEKGYAYSTKSGDVYYIVRKFKEYGKLSNRNIDELLNSKLNESDYLNVLKKLLKNGYEKVSEHAVTNSTGVYVYYDKSAKEIYAFGPLMEKIIINNPKDCYSEISNIVNDNLNTFKNNIDSNPKISFNDKYACFEIDFINKDGYEGSIFQDNEGIIAISSLINPNGEDVLDSFIEINNNSDIITDILILKDLNI